MTRRRLVLLSDWRSPSPSWSSPRRHSPRPAAAPEASEGAVAAGVAVKGVVAVAWRLHPDPDPDPDRRRGHGLGALVLIALAIAYLIITRVMPGASQSWSARKGSGPRRNGASPNASAACRQPRPRPPRTTPRSRRCGEGQRHGAVQAGRVRLGPRGPRRTGPPGRARPAQGVGAPARRPRPPRVAQPGSGDRRANVEYVGLDHSGDKRPTRVTVRVEAELRDYVEAAPATTSSTPAAPSETVRCGSSAPSAMQHGRWVLASIEQGAEGMHAIDEAIVATEWSDETALKDEALDRGRRARRGPSIKTRDRPGRRPLLQGRRPCPGARPEPRRWPVCAWTVLEATALLVATALAVAVDGDDGVVVVDRARPGGLSFSSYPGDPSGHTRLVGTRPTGQSHPDHRGLDACRAAAQR